VFVRILDINLSSGIPACLKLFINLVQSKMIRGHVFTGYLLGGSFRHL